MGLQCTCQYDNDCISNVTAYDKLQSCLDKSGAKIADSDFDAMIDALGIDRESLWE